MQSDKLEYIKAIKEEVLFVAQRLYCVDNALELSLVLQMQGMGEKIDRVEEATVDDGALVPGVACFAADICGAVAEVRGISISSKMIYIWARVLAGS